MSNTGRPPKIVPRRQAAASPPPPAETHYDGSEVPVLIRLPDLSPRPAGQGRVAQQDPAADPVGSEDRAGGGTVRIDNPHSRGRRPYKQPSPLNGVSKSRVAIAAAVLVTAGATYFFMPSGESPQDGHTTPAPGGWSFEEQITQQPHRAGTHTDAEIWPQQGDPAGQTPDTLQPARGLSPQHNVAQHESQPWPSQAEVSLAEPVGADNSADFNQVRTVVGEVDPGVTADQAAGPGSSLWPDSSTKPPRANSQPPRQQTSPGFDQPNRPAPSTGFPSTRTGMLPPRTPSDPAYPNQHSGARLDGDVRVPNPAAAYAPTRRS